MPSNHSTESDPTSRTATPAQVPHKPRTEYFDVADLTKTDARGFIRTVDRYHVEPWGLYLVRTADNVPPYRYTETWLLPKLALRVTMRHVNHAHDRDPEYHIYIGEYARLEPKRWKAVYHYIEIVARNGRVPELHRIDDLFAAHAAGYIDAATAQHAFHRATAVVDGIASHDHNFERWLGTRGIILSWL